MILFPAVDIRDGRAVRLTQGDYDREQVYFDDPLAAAEDWAAQGATHLHVVDLDGALSGERRNLDHLTRIAQGTALPVQYGGGLRNLDAVDAALGAGAWRAIIGTAAFSDREFLLAAVERHGERIVVSADARNGMISAQGWTRTTTLRATDAVAELAAAGVRTFVYTDIERDGMLGGTDTDGMIAIAAAAATGGASVIASGGVGSIEHISDLKELGLANLEGVIAGKALYEQRFTLADALKAV